MALSVSREEKRPFQSASGIQIKKHGQPQKLFDLSAHLLYRFLFIPDSPQPSAVI